MIEVPTIRTITGHQADELARSAARRLVNDLRNENSDFVKHDAEARAIGSEIDYESLSEELTGTFVEVLAEDCVIESDSGDEMEHE